MAGTTPDEFASTDHADKWAEWLLRSRATRDRPLLQNIRERVLENAQIKEGEKVLDVGAGDGLVGFGALSRVGMTGRVVFSDISRDLLNECNRTAQVFGVHGRCDFVEAAADNLTPLGAESIDALTTRSVLTFVKDREQAFCEFYRVVRPGGRISIYEPIASFLASPPNNQLLGLDVSPVSHLAARIRQVYMVHSRAGDNPMLNFDERDLIRYAQEAGFIEIHLDYKAQVDASAHLPTLDWDELAEISVSPTSPTLKQAINQALTEEEQKRFVGYLQTLIKADPKVQTRSASAYLWATRP